ncbi:hypothetical protein EYF80_047135 [Liparis tanakae]|uniref:Uncharacterized protein n=1 Tax=Liparis tanakae TaxID=230148 RepID=A0A4Z2FNQ7_9TELE|nr:hypothetical protein EYF80_047135 [Liparis tanakae]
MGRDKCGKTGGKRELKREERRWRDGARRRRRTVGDPADMSGRCKAREFPSPRPRVQPESKNTAMEPTTPPPQHTTWSPRRWRPETGGTGTLSNLSRGKAGGERKERQGVEVSNGPPPMGGTMKWQGSVSTLRFLWVGEAERVRQTRSEEVRGGQRRSGLHLRRSELHLRRSEEVRGGQGFTRGQRRTGLHPRSEEVRGGQGFTRGQRRSEEVRGGQGFIRGGQRRSEEVRGGQRRSGLPPRRSAPKDGP